MNLITRLFSKDGRLLAYAGETENHMIAAIASGIWSAFNNYGIAVLSSNQLRHVFIECEEGSAIVSLVADVLLCLFSDTPNINAGVLRLKMETIADHLEKPLSQISL